MRINTSKITAWKTASKVVPIKAKPLVNLLVDRTITSKFLLDTLEGKQPIVLSPNEGLLICVGPVGDTWQQSPKKMLQKYSVTAIDADGWMICSPLPNNEVFTVAVTHDLAAQFSYYAPDPATKDPDTFTIIGQYGETIGEEKNVQTGFIGDFVCRNTSDPTDVWIVRRNLFLNTYTIKS